MATLTYTSRFGSIVLGNSAPYIVEKFDPGATKNDFVTTKAYGQDGVTVNSATLQEMSPKIQGFINVDSSQLTAKRLELTHMFTPKSKGILKYTDGSYEKQAECEVDTISFPNRSAGYNKFLITLLCEKPFWLDVVPSSEVLRDFIGGLTFKPLVMPTTFARRGETIIVVNDGDVSAPLRITFLGGSTNPKITNETTGEFVKVLKTIEAGEMLVINTEFGNKTVKIVNTATGEETNAMGYIDLDSSFFSLSVGQNAISFTTDTGIIGVSVYIEWSRRYLQL